MNSFELSGTITAVANAIACGRSVNELALLAAVFVQIGDTLATIAAGRALCEDKSGARE